MTKSDHYKFSLLIRNDDFVVRDHRVHQVRIMPGVTFLDMILRSIQTKGFAPEQVELRNVLFKEPVATSEEHDRKVEITVDRTGSHWTVKARSQKLAGQTPLNDTWVDNLQCELHHVAPANRPPIDLEAIKRGARQLDIDEAYAFMRRIDIKHYEFMQTHGHIYEASECLLAEVRLSGLARQYVDSFYLHPAILDSSTIVQAVFINRQIQNARLSQDEIKPFIPMFIESFRAAKRVGDVCYVLVPEKSNTMSANKDMLYTDIELYDEQGNFVAAFKRLTAKQIRSKDLIQNLQKTQAPAPAEAPVRETVQAPAPAPSVAAAGTSNVRDMEVKLSGMVAALLEKHQSDIDPVAGFYDQGLNSVHLLELVQHLEQDLGQQLYPTLLFEYTTIRDLAGYLASEFGGAASSAVAPVAAPAAAPALGVEAAIENDLRSMVAGLLNMRPEQVEVGDGFYDQGLNSTDLLQLVQQLEQKIGQQLYPTLLFEYTTIRDLAGYLAQEHGAGYQGSAPSTATVSRELPVGTVYFRPVWEPSALPPAQAVGSGAILLLDNSDELRDALQAQLGAEGTVVLVKPGTEYRELGNGTCEVNPADAESFRRVLAGQLPARVLFRWSQADTVNEQLERGIHSLYALIQAMMEIKSKEKVRLLFLNENGNPLDAAVSGFNRSLAMENPKFACKTLELRQQLSSSEIARLAFSEWQADGDADVRYDGGQRFVKRLNVASPVPAQAEGVPLQDGGVYLITGGAGGLGLLFARYIASHASNAKLVLTGRSALASDKQEQLQALGCEAIYLQADVSKREDVERLVQEAKSRFGQINGVIHSAGVIRDSFAMQKTLADVDAVLAPKVHATLHLNDALQGEPLDFFVLFSSITGALGNPGQTDYAYANAFLDAFAEQRNQQEGRTLSINWPLWKEGGMRTDAHNEAMVRQKTGIISLRTESGLQAFEDAFRLGGSQVLVLEGETDRILAGFGARNTAQPASTTAPAPAPAPAKAPLQTSATKSGYQEEEIAIIGVSGRYPQANNLREFWENLKNGVDSITEIPSDRWDYRQDYDPDPTKKGKTHAKWGGFIDDVDKFDPLFFNIMPREAEFMDPQERLFLQTVWETLEDAGYTKSSLSAAKIGVFVGAMWAQYQNYGVEESVKGNVTALSSFFASIANRVSYYFNFHGPSVAMDTMCSSSLTSLHFACESIRRGECEMAVAGGVNVSIHPNKFILLGQGKFASTDGRCRSFGEGGDGYVPGEGVGALLLKPLSKAIADGDQIYGVVKATALNHGGKTSGFSVPTPVGQAEVISDALQKSGINGRTISYLEAHGTGTSLGDPIEITGLSRSFGRHTQDKQFCSIGSVKSNIGHLEAAAGVAAITKVLLQMKHGQLVPSLHSAQVNSQIDFARSAFYLQQELAEWKQPVLVENGIEKTFPRRAGISSFGAGGANAHIILEEYIDPRLAQGVSSGEPCIIVLSARNTDRLQASASQLLRFVRDAIAAGEAPRLEDIACTLQVGREAMEERLSLVVSSLEELTDRLEQYSQGARDIPGLYSGNVRQGRAQTELLVDGREGQEFLKIILLDKKLLKLAQLWTNGVDFDWQLMYPHGGVRRISLPTYPFAKERYWIAQTPNRPLAAIGAGGAPKLHPLLDRNTSTLREQKFTTRFSGQEFFLRDHVIAGNRLLPGVAYVELARAAGEIAAEMPVRAVRNIAWYTPVVAQEGETEVSISLYSLDDESIEFEVHSIGADGQRILHSNGTLELAGGFAAGTLDIEGIRKRCPQEMSGDDYYARFREFDFEYGPSLRAIEHLRVGSSEALARLALPDELAAGFDEFHLHPALMDGALQTVAALAQRGGMLPFSVGEVEIFGALPQVVYVHAAALTAAGASTAIAKFRIELANEAGEVLVRLNDFATKSFGDDAFDVVAVPEGSEEDLALMELLQKIEDGELNADEADELMEELQI